MKITPKVTMLFKGAKSDKRYRLEIGVPVEIDAEEITHVDPSDYVAAEAAPALPPPEKKKRG